MEETILLRILDATAYQRLVVVLSSLLNLERATEWRYDFTYPEYWGDLYWSSDECVARITFRFEGEEGGEIAQISHLFWLASICDTIIEAKITDALILGSHDQLGTNFALQARSAAAFYPDLLPKRDCERYLLIDKIRFSPYALDCLVSWGDSSESGVVPAYQRLMNEVNSFVARQRRKTRERRRIAARLTHAVIKRLEQTRPSSGSD